MNPLQADAPVPSPFANDFDSRTRGRPIRHDDLVRRRTLKTDAKGAVSEIAVAAQEDGAAAGARQQQEDQDRNSPAPHADRHFILC